MKARAKLFFEVSWEVCNKVGGIYTVVSSKAPRMKEHYENYFLIGPYFPEKARSVFEEVATPPECKSCFEALHADGIEVHTGKWLIKGSPRVMLIDYSKFASRVNEIKTALWDKYQLDTLNTQYHDFDEPVVWGWAVGRVIEEYTKTTGLKEVAAQFHEWLSGSALLYLHMNEIKIGTVFTTHATMLGRTLATKGVDIYQDASAIKPEQEAQKHGPGLWAKFQMERICARQANAFTTVSSITALEAENFLGRKPDIILPNGLDIEKFPTLDELNVRHIVLRQKIHTYLMFHFFPYYEFDLDNTLIYFIAGRYEFRDKGIDILIKSLADLNDKLKKEKCEKTIVTFFFVPAGMKGLKSDLLENRTHFYDIKDSLDEQMSQLKNKITYLLLAGKEISKEHLFSEDLITEFRVKIKRFKRQGKPPIVTHDMYDEHGDPIIRALHANNLSNAEDDKVKVVFYPIYLTGADGLLDTTYYESISAGNLGIFPSFYEPWGYTPLEASVHGVSAVTTDVSGFGAYVAPHTKDKAAPGVFIINRLHQSDEDEINQLTQVLYDFLHLSRHERIENNISARKIAEKCDWARFITHYITAHNLALSNQGL